MEKIIKQAIVPITLIFTGIFSNMLVILFNKGMPIIESNYEVVSPLAINTKYVLLNNETVLPFLADIFKVGNYIFAIGDFLIWLGLLVCIVMLFYNILKSKKLALSKFGG